MRQAGLFGLSDDRLRGISPDAERGSGLRGWIEGLQAAV